MAIILFNPMGLEIYSRAGQPTLSLEQQVLIFFECVFAIVTTNLYHYGGGRHVHQPALSPDFL
jgi:hypothetical protein